MTTRLFNESSLGRPKMPRIKPSGVSRGERPAFHFDYCPAKGLSRQGIESFNLAPFFDQAISIDLAALSSWANRPLSAVETDWIHLAMAIYSADRFASRRPGGSGGQSLWSRSIRLRVAVADPIRWNRAKELLIHALKFLTDDEWLLDFTRRDSFMAEELQEYLNTQVRPQPSWICLFSGGLDSLAGYKHLTRELGGSGLLVSGCTHERLRCGQSDIISKLGHERGKAFEWLQTGYGFPKIIDSSFMESSQRSRGWVHVALGLMAAATSNCDVLDVCKNGIGAFNLPTELSQTGSHTSRAVHPVFLHRIAKAASAIFERELKVRQSAVFETKGELLKRTFHRDEESLAALSFSCEIFPNYNAKQHQCGVCPSCLVRRAALHAAGMTDPNSDYSFDVYSPNLPQRKTIGLLRMERYVRRIERGFGPHSPIDSALWEYPEAGSYFDEAARSLDLNLDEFLEKLRRLHQSFALEWKSFAASLPGRYPTTEIAA